MAHVRPGGTGTTLAPTQDRCHDEPTQQGSGAKSRAAGRGGDTVGAGGARSGTQRAPRERGAAPLSALRRVLLLRRRRQPLLLSRGEVVTHAVGVWVLLEGCPAARRGHDRLHDRWVCMLVRRAHAGDGRQCAGTLHRRRIAQEPPLAAICTPASQPASQRGGSGTRSVKVA